MFYKASEEHSALRVEGKQNSLFPVWRRVIKCFVVPPNSKIARTATTNTCFAAVLMCTIWSCASRKLKLVFPEAVSEFWPIARVTRSILQSRNVFEFWGRTICIVKLMFINIFIFVFFIILDEVQPVPVQVPYVKPDPEKANPKIGVGQVAFSRDNRYLATKNGKYIVANGGKPCFFS